MGQHRSLSPLPDQAKKKPAEAGLFVSVRISIAIAVMVASAAAIIFVPPAMILPIGIAEIQCAWVGQTADCAARERADSCTRSGGSGCRANYCTCACTNGGTRYGTFAGVRAAGRKAKGRNQCQTGCEFAEFHHCLLGCAVCR